MKRQVDDDADARPSWWLRTAPLALIGAVTVTDVLLGSGPQRVVLGLVATAPLLAAVLVGPYLTAGYAAVALLAAVAMGSWDEQYSAAALPAQLVRLVAIVLAGIVGVAAADYRQRREIRLRQLTRVAEAAQRAILIPVPQRLEPVHLAVSYESAASEALIGGDLYGVMAGERGVRILVADVRGKGLDAVRLSAQVLASFRERAWDHEDLVEVLGGLDRSVRRTAAPEDFVTAVLAELTDVGRLRLVLAGHPAPLVIREGAALRLPPGAPGIPLGLDGGPPDVLSLRLAPGDRVLFYTDGLTEARSPGDGRFLPEPDVVEVVARGPLAECLTRLTLALRAWTGGGLQDDVALLLLEYDPAPPPPRPVPADAEARTGARTGTGAGALVSPAPADLP